jgi:bifunctional isochorismate lyase/aryl carrier protein
MTIPKIAAYPMPEPASFPANRTAWQPDPGRAVLLIHDMQRYFLRFYEAETPLMRALVGNLVRLRAWARAHGVPVFYTAQPREQPTGDRALLNDMWGRASPWPRPACRRSWPTSRRGRRTSS